MNTRFLKIWVAVVLVLTVVSCKSTDDPASTSLKNDGGLGIDLNANLETIPAGIVCQPKTKTHEIDKGVAFRFAVDAKGNLKAIQSDLKVTNGITLKIDRTKLKVVSKEPLKFSADASLVVGGMTIGSYSFMSVEAKGKSATFDFPAASFPKIE